MKPLIAVVGPTASGKTAFAVDLALALNGEIVSGDSMQIYRGMDIGTGKITRAEARGVPHHLLDIKDPREAFSVAEFQTLARSAIRDIHHRGRLPILVGGTGLYIQAAVDPYEFLPQEQGHVCQYRERMKQLGAEKGPLHLHGLLAQKDPASAAKLHPNDVKRVIRALEYAEIHGRPISSNNQARQGRAALYRTVFLGLRWERAVLYQRINRRVDEMLQQGWVLETAGLLAGGVPKEAQSMQALGYRHIIRYLEEAWTLEQCAEQIKMETRRFAKRQWTWFRRDPRVTWIPPGAPLGTLDEIMALAKDWRRIDEGFAE
jgi:tRNA dimethylallyltransferase